ncbi:hypothetical protein CfE428DRAFT_4506 [Chthoniobacter flavus Ellin428]|uniref:Cytochrome c family protein n=1 Tax=Chthoniobacter flavus Ellin428 TaxID=497964 RepID=B4D6G6_9BACT|nr:hypothetical protein [Chthoniobacter flavus]EDY18075.1 hypothetical protein CfE428DRAFT_4506 [Chthoniobacter flavus Ellin428]TCO88316.1 hypothetical protein EV701_118113 [Chthoniobacter flavus]
MFRPVYSVLLFALVAAVSTYAAENGAADFEGAYFKATEQAKAEYRQAFAASLSKATKAEIYLLDFEVQHHDPGDIQWQIHPPKDQFPIEKGKTCRILKRKILTGDEIKKLLPSLQATIGAKENHGGAMCHFPIHGLRLWTGDQLVLETNICWSCHNLYLQYPDYTMGVIGAWNKTLEEFMKDWMPIPEEELARFQAKYGNSL